MYCPKPFCAGGFMVFLLANVGLHVLATADSNELYICCANGWLLMQIDVGIFSPYKYECIPQSQLQQHSAHAKSEVFGGSRPMQGVRLLPAKSKNGSASFLQCGNPQYTIITGSSDVQLMADSCLIHTKDDGLAAFYCSSSYEMKRLSILKKCCPLNFVYNEARRKCVKFHQEQLLNFSAYTEFFAHVGVFSDAAVSCPRDKVLVEYHLRSSEFSFDDSQLLLSMHGISKSYSINEYCIEAIATPHAEDASSMLPRLLQSSAGYLVRVCDDRESVCDKLPCIRRCCADGEMFMRGNATAYCKDDTTDISFHSFESLDINGNFSKPAVFGILRSLDCMKYRLNPDIYADEQHTISNRDGSLYVMTTGMNYTNNKYCVEKPYNASSSDQKLYTFLCFDSKVVGNDKIRFKMYPIGLLISCSFYAITLLVYLSISKLRNLPGQILICLVCSLFAAYLGIALGQLMPTSNDDVCFASGFFVYFCLLAAFSWMNVMCFDIWQTFGTAKKKTGFQGKTRKRFLLYSLYGWGLPTLLTITTVSLTKAHVLSEDLQPHFGHGRCWFTYDHFASANLVFFSGPVGVLFLFNFVLFTLTLRYCNKVKREIFRMQSSNNEKPMLRRRFFVDKARFAMNTKLFVVMGITWLLELLSILLYDHKRQFFWAISDSFNVLLGVLVFFIFVCKKRVWHLILERLGKPTPASLKQPTATYGTHSTYAPHSISMTRLNAIDGNALLLNSRTNTPNTLSPGPKPKRAPTM